MSLLPSFKCFSWFNYLDLNSPTSTFYIICFMISYHYSPDTVGILIWSPPKKNSVQHTMLYAQVFLNINWSLLIYMHRSFYFILIIVIQLLIHRLSIHPHSLILDVHPCDFFPSSIINFQISPSHFNSQIKSLSSTTKFKQVSLNSFYNSHDASSSW